MLTVLTQTSLQLLLASAGYHCTGLDISTKLIEVGRRKYPQIAFLVGDAEHLPFADASFDGVLLSGMVHHFPDPSRWPPRSAASCGGGGVSWRLIPTA
jgi:ubiquinone/menaquinone biosynthesis C-methylase UbiE